jgi:hypothetical protein
VIVGGAQEKGKTELALVYGLQHRQGRELVLVLPHEHVGPTLLRLAWLKQVTAGIAPKTSTSHHVELVSESATAIPSTMMLHPSDSATPSSQMNHAGNGTFFANAIPP